MSVANRILLLLLVPLVSSLIKNGNFTPSVSHGPQIKHYPNGEVPHWENIAETFMLLSTWSYLTNCSIPDLNHVCLFSYNEMDTFLVEQSVTVTSLLATYELSFDYIVLSSLTAEAYVVIQIEDTIVHRFIVHYRTSRVRWSGLVSAPSSTFTLKFYLDQSIRYNFIILARTHKIQRYVGISNINLNRETSPTQKKSKRFWRR